MVEATIEDLAFPHRASKEHDHVMRQGCIEHTLEKEVGSGSNRGHHSSEPKVNGRSSAAAEKGGEGMGNGDGSIF